MVESPGAVLDLFIPVHDGNVDSVEEDEKECLVPLHPFIVYDTDKDGHSHTIG